MLKNTLTLFKYFFTIKKKKINPTRGSIAWETPCGIYLSTMREHYSLFRRQRIYIQQTEHRLQKEPRKHKEKN